MKNLSASNERGDQPDRNGGDFGHRGGFRSGRNGGRGGFNRGNTRFTKDKLTPSVNAFSSLKDSQKPYIVKYHTELMDDVYDFDELEIEGVTDQN